MQRTELIEEGVTQVPSDIRLAYKWLKFAKVHYAIQRDVVLVTVDLPPVISLVHILRFICTYLINNKIYDNF